MEPRQGKQVTCSLENRVGRRKVQGEVGGVLEREQFLAMIRPNQIILSELLNQIHVIFEDGNYFHSAHGIPQ